MEATTAPEGEARSLSFVRNKIASFLAFAPLTLWTIVHIWDNLSAFKGAETWETNVTGHRHPMSLWITSIIVLLPLVIHTIWGVQRLFTSRPNNNHYGYYNNFRYLLQRLSAIGVLLFIAAHLWLAFIHPRVVENHAETFADIAAHMRHHPPTLIVYLLGTLGVAYHLGNGLSGFAWNWGIAATRKAVTRFERAGVVLFAVLLVMSWAAIFALWQAGAAFPVPLD